MSLFWRRFRRENVEQIITRYSLASCLPSTVLAALEREPATGSFDHVQNLIVGSNAQAARAAIEQARREGFRARVLTTSLHGEAREAGMRLAQILRRAQTRPLCLIAGGETTVTVTGARGRARIGWPARWYADLTRHRR